MASEEITKKRTEKMVKWRKRLLTLLFVAINVIVIVVTATNEFGGGSEAADLSNIQLKWWMLVPAAVAFVVAQGAEIYKYYMVMRDTWAGKDRFEKRKGMRIALETVLLGRYYDNITPAAVGGQPFQIFYMNKSGVKGGYGTVIPLMGMITDQLAFLVVGMFAILLGSFAGWITEAPLVAAGWIGLLFYAFFPVMILLATFLPKATEEVIHGGVKFLTKIKIIKDEVAARDKALASVKEYAGCIKVVLKDKRLFWKTMGLSAVNYVGMLMIPFFVLTTFGAEVNIVVTMCTMAAVQAAVYFVPTPGNAGAAEGVFYSVFSAVGGYVFWAMLFWRLFAYYSFLLMGAVTQLVVYTRDKNIMKVWNKGVVKVQEEAVQHAKDV